MAQAGQLENTIQEMERLKIQVLGVSEMRWPGSGHKDVDKHRIYYSGTTNNTSQYGVGMIIQKSLVKQVTNFLPLTERIMLLQINARPANVNMIQVYAPTTDHSEEEVMEFYGQIADIMRSLPKQDLNMLMGDFNAKVGKGKSGKHIGEFGLGERNERGEILSTFAAEQDLVVMNTFFKQHPRRLYTWKSPDKITRNQIDFVLINDRFKNSLLSVKTYPGADVRSDHNPLVGKLRTKLKKVKKKPIMKYDYRILKANTIRKTVMSKLQAIGHQPNENTPVEEDLDHLKKEINKIKEEYLKPNPEMKKIWMTEEILALMAKRRTFKNKTDQYKCIQREIRRKIREAKEKDQMEKCLEIEKCQEKGDCFNLHKKVKEMAGINKKRTINIVTNNEGKVLLNKEEIKNTWEVYIKELFHDTREDPPTIEGDEGPKILEVEVKSVLKQAKERKAVGPDEIPTDILKLLDGENLRWITNVFNKIYNSGTIPQEWLRSEFIILPKKPNARKCSEYRTISLMSHLLKIFLKVIHGRIYKKCEEQISDTQFGFRRAVGTREALFSIQVLFQRCRDVNCDVYACFIDYQKAFDRVQHSKMMEVLEKVGLDHKDLKIIANLYWNQVASVKLEDECTEDVQILRGVRQGCVISPVIFNVYSEYIFREILQTTEAGIWLNGERINNIRYADDTVIFTDNINTLQTLMDKVYIHSKEYGLDINIQKTKFMTISKVQNIQCSLKIEGNTIERVKQYTYLGTNVNEDWDHSREIKIRIEKARSVYNRMKKVFRSHDLTMDTKVRLLRCYVFSVLFYGVEAWTLTEATSDRLEAFEMWLYRRMLKISWKDKVTNTEVLNRMKKGKEILKTIKIRKLQYLGHVMRNENRYLLLQKILQGKVEGRRGRGRRRISWLKNLRTWFNQTTTQLFRAAVNKVQIAIMIANVRTGQAP
ncbi:hypothetical protein WDU94_009869 [Cyamophila willieti]